MTNRPTPPTAGRTDSYGTELPPISESDGAIYGQRPAACPACKGTGMIDGGGGSRIPCDLCAGAEQPAAQMRLYVCACDQVYPGQPHHPECPAQRQYDAIAAELAAANERIAQMERELASVLADWNALVQASGSPTNGGAIGHVASLRRDAARYRWLRDMAEAQDNPEAAEWVDDDSHAVCLLIHGDGGDIVYESGFGTDALDELIDAALKEPPRGQ